MRTSGIRGQTTLTSIFVLFLTTYPPSTLIFSILSTLTKSRHFGLATQYPPHLVNLVCERPLTLKECDKNVVPEPPYSRYDPSPTLLCNVYLLCLLIYYENLDIFSESYSRYHNEHYCQYCHIQVYSLIRFPTSIDVELSFLVKKTRS